MSQPHHTRDEGTENTVTGLRVAIVRDNEDPENLGRVKLGFPWRDADDKSHWARVATEMTGGDYGTYFLPEVGDEVLVGFENGDIHRPMVIGSLYSGNRKPADNNSDGNNDVRSITTRSGHKIEFDDNDQNGIVTIETNAGHKVELDDASGSEKVTIEDKSGNSVEIDAVKNSISLSADQKISMEAPTIELSADGKVDVSSDGKVDISGKGQAAVSSKGQLKLEASGIAKLDADGIAKISGALVQIN
jgi:uncharacterized protein involved in type VI secretion and phage assembly